MGALKTTNQLKKKSFCKFHIFFKNLCTKITISHFCSISNKQETKKEYLKKP